MKAKKKAASEKSKENILSITSGIISNSAGQIGISKIFDLQKYKIPDIHKTHSPFEGAARKHPNDDAILLLFTDPFKTDDEFYEFSIETIGYVEDIGTITSENGESALKARVWVKKGVPALKVKSFIV
jgi:hypothetical protein